jgi:multidrug efflux system outer membrane protein
MAAALLTACMVGPDYRRPEIDVPPAWRVSDNEAARISNIAWWDQFDDPVLSGLVRAALASNKDLQIAIANVDQAAAQYGIVHSAEFPEVNAGASASRSRLSATTGTAAPGGHAFNAAVSLSASFNWISGAGCGVLRSPRARACSPASKASARSC